jgi:RimJ/RimL family protein N-acetyltransferase
VEDAQEIVEAVTESLPELRPWMPWAKEPVMLDFQIARIRQVMAQWITRQELGLHAYLKGTSTLVLSSGLHRIDWQSGKFETGYWVRTPYTGQGFVTEAVNGIAAFAFKQLHANRVEIRCDAQNIRSAAVAKRCGFLLEGILRHDSLDINGELRSTMIFSKLSATEFNYYDE